MVKAGKDRYLVVHNADGDKYEVAIRSLGWLDGQDPPWVTAGGSAK